MGTMEEVLGLECKAAWCSKILSGEKKIESRAYTLPEPLNGKRLWLISSSGQEGVSSVPDIVSENYEGLTLVGWIVVSHVKEYVSHGSWEADISDHCVPPDTPYSWQPGFTDKIFGWCIAEYEALPSPKPNPRMKRSFRSLFTLEQ